MSDDTTAGDLEVLACLIAAIGHTLVADDLSGQKLNGVRLRLQRMADGLILPGDHKIQMNAAIKAQRSILDGMRRVCG